MVVKALKYFTNNTANVCTTEIYFNKDGSQVGPVGHCYLTQAVSPSQVPMFVCLLALPGGCVVGVLPC